jgi:hypothetical protein
LFIDRQYQQSNLNNSNDWSRGEHTTILLIYDSDGNLVAESSGASELGLRIGDGAAPGTELSAGMGDGQRLSRVPELAAWVTTQIAEARSNQSHTAQSSLQYQGGMVSLRFEILKFHAEAASGNDASRRGLSVADNSGSETRYAVIVSPTDSSIPEGASVITRQQWHDIKNHLGGLKLYATFLKKKTVDGDDQAIVEKMLNGINGLIDHLAQIRGGDAK